MSSSKSEEYKTFLSINQAQFIIDIFEQYKIEYVVFSTKHRRTFFTSITDCI